MTITEDEVEKKAQEYFDEFDKMYFAAEEFDHDECRRNIDILYERVFKQKKVPVVILNNPVECYLEIARHSTKHWYVKLFLNRFVKTLTKYLPVNLFDSIRDFILSQKAESVQKQLHYRFMLFNFYDVKKEIKSFYLPGSSHFYSRLPMSRYQYSVESNFKVKAKKTVKLNIKLFLELYGHFHKIQFNNIYFIKFASELLGIQFLPDEILSLYKLFSYGEIYPLKDVCFVSKNPLYFNMVEGKLHADLKPALKWAGLDDLNIYALNGVILPEWLVMTPREKLDPKKIHEIENTEVRQQFIKKIGVEKLLNELNTEILDEVTALELYKFYPITNYIQHGDKIIEPENEIRVQFSNLKKGFQKRLNDFHYKLINLEIWDGFKEPYLYMTNASLPHEVHIEGVSEGCRSVFEAICWRNNKKSLPMEIT